MQIKFKKLRDNAKPFVYSREDDACMDMFTLESKTLKPHETAVFNTGIALEIPSGYEGIIRGRSGWESKGLQIFTGTIESSYRGDIGIIAHNTTTQHIHLEAGAKIAQFTVKPVFQISLIETNTLSETKRGVNGYGSSGF